MAEKIEIPLTPLEEKIIEELVEKILTSNKLDFLEIPSKDEESLIFFSSIKNDLEAILSSLKKNLKLSAEIKDIKVAGEELKDVIPLSIDISLDPVKPLLKEKFKEDLKNYENDNFSYFKFTLLANLWKLEEILKNFGLEIKEVKKGKRYREVFSSPQYYNFTKDILEIYEKFFELFEQIYEQNLEDKKGLLNVKDEANINIETQIAFYVFTAGMLGVHGQYFNKIIEKQEEFFKKYFVSIVPEVYVYEEGGERRYSFKKPEGRHSYCLEKCLVVPKLYFDMYREDTLFEWHIALKIREFFHDYNIPAITLQNINVSRKNNGQQEIEMGEIDVLICLIFNKPSSLEKFILVECKRNFPKREKEIKKMEKKVEHFIEAGIQDVQGLIVTLHDFDKEKENVMENNKVKCISYYELEKELINMIFKLIKNDLT